MPVFLQLLCNVLFVLNILQFSSCDDEFELTLEVGAGQKECFYHFIPRNTPFEVDVQVIEGGDMDISVQVQDPLKNVLVFDNRRTEAYHQLNSGPSEGDFSICLDNTFSRFTPKLATLQLVVDVEEPEGEFKADYDFEGVYSTKLEDFKSTVASTKKKLDECMQTLNYMKTVEARDRSIAEHNFERVNFWSAVHIIVMITAGLTQVLMIRSLFDEKGRLKKLFAAKT